MPLEVGIGVGSGLVGVEAVAAEGPGRLCYIIVGTNVAGDGTDRNPT